ncbi:MAG: type II toxin-antitoxin system VapC family toxin [Calditrichia bacterium]|nr:type II toxin-antitoxin system VapC family toxin [Calditrichia bacterium]
MAYLIDTDIIIYSLKGNEKVKNKFEEFRVIPKSISVITYGELVYGARKSSYIEKNMGLVHRISELFEIIPINKAVMETFGEIKAGIQRKGVSIDDMDLIIGCTALIHNYTLVTNNIKHFTKIPGVKIENWAE